MRHHLLFLCFLTCLLSGLVQSCSKGVTAVIKMPYTDTAGMLTGHKWLLTQLWYDMNNNGRIDSGELVNGFDFVDVYSFSPGGSLADSSVSYLSRTGSWSFQGGYHTTIQCSWTGSSDSYYLVGISDSTLVARRLTTDETWYFVQHT